MKLYELAGADGSRLFSPYCWRIRLALLHKGLRFQSIPWRFTDKDVIAFSGQGRVPVLIDGKHTISDSWAIAEYLDAEYPSCPSLFGSDYSRALTRFIQSWTDEVVEMQVLRMIIVDIYEHLHEKDKAYFRRTREQHLGAPLESSMRDRDECLQAFRNSLAPLRMTFETQPFLGGDEPIYADYIAFSPFQWARCTSSFQLLLGSDPVAAWRNRMLNLFDGHARSAVGYD